VSRLLAWSSLIDSCHFSAEYQQVCIWNEENAAITNFSTQYQEAMTEEDDYEAEEHVADGTEASHED
jgi:hypothetical protein